jgi:hypothetical protein
MAAWIDAAMQGQQVRTLLCSSVFHV